MIKLVGLDVYGTILCSTDKDNEMPSRKGFSELVKKCTTRGIIITSVSDSNIAMVKLDLKDSKVDLKIFNDFYELVDDPKDFSYLIEDYGLMPEEILIIGDSDKDINGAKAVGAKYIRVPEYKALGDKYDLGKIRIEDFD
ncbi:MAG: HAD family hydrolase [Candidatus Pacearchaeota archaeon]